MRGTRTTGTHVGMNTGAARTAVIMAASASTAAAKRMAGARVSAGVIVVSTLNEGKYYVYELIIVFRRTDQCV
jgi:hypothetical protein